jgi:hypothetical protein
MAKQKVKNCYNCGNEVSVLPADGGRLGQLTTYSVDCKCGIKETELGWKDGRTRTAIADWNRICKEKRAS